jgi:hypothetical protein
MTDFITLARRAVNCRKHWRWIEGMAIVESHMPLDKRLPDLTHPATLGCLLAIVRQAYGEPRMALVPMSDGKWAAQSPLHIGPQFTRDTEAEALVAALEAAN